VAWAWANPGLPGWESHGSELQTQAKAEGRAPLVGQGTHGSRENLENSA